MRIKKLWLATIATLWCSLTASAHDFEVGGIYYKITSPTDLTVAVTYSGGSYDSVSDEYSGAVTIPSTVTYNNNTYSVMSIGMYAFNSCRYLTSITIPASVTSIEEEAFNYCSSLISIIVADGNPIFDSRDGCNAIIGTKSNTLIQGCNSSTIPEGVTCIGYGAFAYFSNLTSITIPASVTSIEEFAFIGCNNLTEINIPENSQLTSIGIYAFTNTAWNNNLPNGVIYLGKVLYSYKGTMPENTSIDVKDGTTCIASNAFSGCSSLTAIALPEGVTSIGRSAFSGCSSLTSIIIPKSVTRIGFKAFEGCSSLTSITIPESVTSIGDGAFLGCSNLTSITIPEGVTSIGRCAFSGCTSLASIYMKSPVSITSDVFYGVDRNTCTLYVPGASLEKYRLSSIWGEFNNLLAWYKVAYIVDGEEIAHQWLFVGDEISMPILEGYEGYSFESQAWEGMIPKPINIADNADAMLYTNAPCTETKYGDQFVGWHVLFDGNANTFFHSEYKSGTESADGLEHYLRVDMGEGKGLKEFSFSYTVRGNQNWCTPKVIVVEGSNDADGEYAEIAKLTDLPSDKGAQYNSEILGNGTSYRYIRYRVIETPGNETVKGKPYFYIAEFGMTEVQRFEIEETNQMPAYDVVVNGCFVNNDNVETDIHTSELEAQGSQVIYDLMGRCVEKMENGIYIVNGIKVVIK